MREKGASQRSDGPFFRGGTERRAGLGWPR